MFLLSFLVIPTHSSFAYSYIPIPKPIHTSWTPLSMPWTSKKLITLNQNHIINPYAPLGSQSNQIYTQSVNDFSGLTNYYAQLGTQFNPIYIRNNNDSPGIINYYAPIGSQFNPIYLSPLTGF